MRAAGSPYAMLLAAALGGLLLVPGVSFGGVAHPTVARGISPTSGAAPIVGLRPLASPTGPTVTNGVVTLQFAGRYPSYTLVSVNDSRIALGQVLSGLAEVDGNGQIVASANFLGNAVNWNFLTTNTSAAVWETLAAKVSVVVANGTWESGDEGSALTVVGHVNASVVFQLNASAGPDPSTLSYTLNVSKWPWRNVSDVLGVELRMTAVSDARLAPAPGASAVNELDNATNGTLARYFWASEATASYSGGSHVQSSVGAFQAITIGGGGSLVKLNFTMVQGGYSELSYDPWITLNLAAFPSAVVPAWLVTPQALAVIGAGAVVAAGLAVVAWRQRRTAPPPP